jgi:Domain of unknown function (DUF4203)
MVVFFLSIVAGLLLGLICAMWVKFGFFILGGWLGASVGMMAYNAFLSALIGSGSRASTIMLVVIVLFVIAGGVLMMYLFEHALVLSSAVTGSYALVRVRFYFNILRGWGYLLEAFQMSILYTWRFKTDSMRR